ncbi:Coiled-coil domain-containing protein 90-like [Heracleum sosnowskyi]|uniref:Coiled-coil domain-containing protein 90-like n=1 Tax=Heracleum sosnowskyi TaxID=360622 RepID=A0AAD8HLK2_9APIA|nr:Coiled-coil domain-containing protein 90-like [Heracleum sosnowskyi]
MAKGRRDVLCFTFTQSMGVYKRVFHNSAICLSKLASAKLYGTTAAAAASNSGGNHLTYANLNASRAFLVDTLALVRRLEAQGVPSPQAEAITAAITQVLNDSLENVSHAFVSRADSQKGEMLQEANLSKFKAEIQSSQEHHFSLLQRETEKLQNDIGKIRSELKYEVDKVTAGQRLDLNLERGRTRDELANQSTETTNLNNKIDREIQGIRAQLEGAKYDIIKYCIGTLVSVSAVGLAILRIVMKNVPHCSLSILVISEIYGKNLDERLVSLDMGD